MILDFHTHCFPEKIAEKAISHLSFASGGIVSHSDGTAAGLVAHQKSHGVDVSCVMNIATNPRQMKKVNDFAASIASPELIPFGSVHPEAPDAPEELERIRSLGMPGVKLHPEYQDFAVDDPAMKPIYRKISDLGLILLFHAGKDYGYPAPYRCEPEALARALDWIDSPVVAAHWGGLGMSEEVLRVLAGRDVYFDTSYACGTVSRPMMMRIAERHGTDKLLFGTDMPWHSPEDELRMIDTLGFSDGEKENVLSGNALRLLGMNQ